jgi:hypothetical protein
VLHGRLKLRNRLQRFILERRFASATRRMIGYDFSAEIMIIMKISVLTNQNVIPTGLFYSGNVSYQNVAALRLELIMVKIIQIKSMSA